MYLSKVRLKNIRSFEDTTVEFKPQAGWHVLLGDNGSGKSTLLRSIALGMIEEREVQQLTVFEAWKDWLRYKEKEASITLVNGERKEVTFDNSRDSIIRTNNNNNSSTFSAAFGSYRRLSGGSQDYDVIWANSSSLAAHLSVFKENVALNQVEKWIEELVEIERTPKEDKKGEKYWALKAYSK